MSSYQSPLVTAEWLYNNLHLENLIILDGSIPKVGGKEESPAEKKYIKGAYFIDIENSFSDENSSLPHTMLNETEFTKEAQKLGVNHDSIIVVYDIHGIYSSPRVWWMFKSMGFDSIYVLDGGLPAWEKAGYPVVNFLSEPKQAGNYEAVYIDEYFVSQKQVLESLNDDKSTIIDARSSVRFNGTAPEPRKGLRSGHIPGSENIPYEEVLSGNTFRSMEDLKQIFQERTKFDNKLIFSCGSGITASVDALAAKVAGFKNVSVYDGSWSEWGQPSDYPVEKE